jgi:hypothetical protein
MPTKNCGSAACSSKPPWPPETKEQPCQHLPHSPPGWPTTWPTGPAPADPKLPSGPCQSCSARAYAGRAGNGTMRPCVWLIHRQALLNLQRVTPALSHARTPRKGRPAAPVSSSSLAQRKRGGSGAAAQGVLAIMLSHPTTHPACGHRCAAPANWPDRHSWR